MANEGGLSREDFGHISIRADHSLVDLPADLPREVTDKLTTTRISGRLIDLRPDDGRRSPASRPDRERPSRTHKRD